jgi:mannose-6-phosphate isomerase-like protein (cupin superfamily)
MISARRDIFRALSDAFRTTGFLADDTKTLPSKIYDFDAMPTRNAGSLIYRGIFDGAIYEGCHISLHESDLAPHSEPHPPHQHRHEEMVLILEGTLEFTINGKSTRAGAGSVMFAGSNDLHGIRNPDDTRAKYFVFALGPENQ